MRAREFIQGLVQQEVARQLRALNTSAPQSASPALVTVPAAWTLREGQPLTIRNCAGMTEANGQSVYLKITGAQSAQLYTDAALTTPFDTTTYGDYTPSTGELFGYYGSMYYCTITGKKLFGTNTAKVLVRVAWKEVVQ